MLLTWPGPQFITADETFTKSLLLPTILLMSNSVFSSLLDLSRVSWGTWVLLVLRSPLFHELFILFVTGTGGFITFHPLQSSLFPIAGDGLA